MQENINSHNPLKPGKGNTTTGSKQIKPIFHFLTRHTSTSSMSTSLNGVPQKRITRYKRDLEKDGLLAELWIAPYHETGFNSHFLTTNPGKCPKSNQFKIF